MPQAQEEVGKEVGEEVGGEAGEEVEGVGADRLWHHAGGKTGQQADWLALVSNPHVSHARVVPAEVVVVVVAEAEAEFRFLTSLGDQDSALPRVWLLV